MRIDESVISQAHEMTAGWSEADLIRLADELERLSAPPQRSSPSIAAKTSSALCAGSETSAE